MDISARFSRNMGHALGSKRVKVELLEKILSNHNGFNGEEISLEFAICRHGKMYNTLSSTIMFLGKKGIRDSNY